MMIVFTIPTEIIQVYSHNYDIVIMGVIVHYSCSHMIL